jgi:cofilin
LKTSFVKFEANAASAGMSVSDECTMKFMELKRKRTYWYIISRIDEKLQQITLEKTGAPSASYEDFNCTTS